MSNNRHYVYILKCKAQNHSNFYYVGETAWIDLRLINHFSGKGGQTTSIYKPEEVLCIYDIKDLIDFFAYDKRINYYIANYKNFIHKEFLNMALLYYREEDKMFYDSVNDNLNCEDFITERMMLHHWKLQRNFTLEGCNIRGGQYIIPTINYTPLFTKEKLETLPICKCGLPCTVKLQDDKDIYFYCAKTNLDKSIRSISVPMSATPCNFKQLYTKTNFLYSLLSSKDIPVVDIRAKW